MTQAFNLALMANNLNTSGRLDASDGLVNAVPVANGGTGQTSLTSGSLVAGNGTSAVSLIAPSTSGNVLTSNGTAWVSAAAPSSAPTTAQVLSATAGASANGVGTYAIAAASSATNVSFGSTKAGSGLFASLAGAYNIVCGGYSSGSTNVVLSTQLAGTWRCMGNITAYSNYQTTLWLRIS